MQFCGFTPKDFPAITNIDSKPFGQLNPATHIPTISEADARAMKPDYCFVLLWHSRKDIFQAEEDYLNATSKFIFPFPKIEFI